MEHPAVHHLVTIRLEEHVEQLERAYRSFLNVRRRLDEAQQALRLAEPAAALECMQRAGSAVHEALKGFELPCAEPA